jgi:nitrogen permease regulator 3-like protein
VGHPTLVNNGSVLINIQFALRATASHAIVKCYYDLSRRLGVALRHEEKRCGYVGMETKAMVTAHDEAQSSPYSQILARSALARDLKMVYEELCLAGQVHLRVNNWIEVSFCLPHRLHPKLDPDLLCIQALRPYYGLLLLVETFELLSGLPSDTSPALIRLLQVKI